LELKAKNLEPEFESFFCCFGNPGPRFERLMQEGYEGLATDDVEELRGFIEDKEIDIVHYHGRGLDDVVIEISDDIEFIVKTANFGWTSRDKEELKSVVDRYVFPSKFTFYRYSQLYNNQVINSRTTQVYHSIDHSELEESDNPIINEEKRTVIGRIGRSDENKWSDLFLRAFERTAETHDVLLLILNPPEFVRNEIEERGLEDSVKIVEDIELGKISRFYTSIDILAHSSHIGESFGYVVAEGMASGVPVVVESTPVKDNAQIELIDNREIGFVAASVGGFEECIKELVEDENLRKKMGEKAFDSSRENFNIERVSNDIESVYRNLGKNSANVGFDLESFKKEYRLRLKNIKGPEDWYHAYERYAWYISELSSSEFVYRKMRAISRRLKKLY
jgi:Glycosyltransferase